VSVHPDPSLVTTVEQILGAPSAQRLTPEEEVTLSAFLQELEEGAEPERRLAELAARAKERFVAANMGLVVSIARRYASQGVVLDDLIQEGIIGLLRAIELYDGRRGFRFSTYATWWIRQAILQAIARSTRELSLPRGIAAELARLEQVRRELEQQLGRQASITELAGVTGIDELRIRELQGYAQAVLSLDQQIGEDQDATLADVVPDQQGASIEETIEHADLRTVIAGALGHLEPREREVLCYRFGLEGQEPHTLEQAAAHFGIARERVRQIEARAIARLRRGEAGPVLREVLED
jgi:RNA polymerase sigma factor (sigma-70 family)